MSNEIHIIKSQLLLLQHLAAGLTLKEIAATLSISHNTVKTRVKTLYKKFNVSSRKELINKALKLNLLKHNEVKPKFRKRFVKIKAEMPEPVLIRHLTAEEARFLYLISEGFRIKDIIKTMELSGIYHARILKVSICWKLNSQNIVQAAVCARLLEII